MAPPHCAGLTPGHRRSPRPLEGKRDLPLWSLSAQRAEPIRLFPASPVRTLGALAGILMLIAMDEARAGRFTPAIHTCHSHRPFKAFTPAI
eukprot:6175946-Pleurochrysis_carterae.AAC.2